MLYVITGANRGIGLEFVGQLLERGDSVIATARTPDEADDLHERKQQYGERLEIVGLDVSEKQSIDALADHVGDRGVDVLINNAGTLIRAGDLENLDEDAIRTSIDVNTLGPLRTTAALLPALERPDQSIICNVSSKMGSIAENSSGGSYAYRVSKAGLNMATRSMALDLVERQIFAFVIHPGWVQTRMGGSNALIDTETSVSNMLDIIDKADRDTAATFQEWNGNVIPW